MLPRKKALTPQNEESEFHQNLHKSKQKWTKLNVLDLENDDDRNNESWREFSSKYKKTKLKPHSYTITVQPETVLTTLKWDDRLDDDNISMYRRLLNNNVRDTINEVVYTSPMFNRMSRKLVVLKQFYQLTAEGHDKCEQKAKNLTSPHQEEMSIKLEEAANPLDNLAQVGSRFALSFVFSFLRRAWRSGEDSDLCTELLEDTLMALNSLPPASLFNQALSPTWSEVLRRSTAFLKSIAVSDFKSETSSRNLSTTSEGCDTSISEKDQQLALQIMLKLSLQRGTLSQFLDTILFLLNLSEKRKHTADILKSSDLRGAPLLPYLTEVKQLTDEIQIMYCPDKKIENTDDPNEILLKYISLPEKPTVLIDLKQSAMISLAYVNSLVLNLLCKYEPTEIKTSMGIDEDESFDIDDPDTSSAPKPDKLSTNVPLSCDVTEHTFDVIDAILQKVASGVDKAWPPSQEHECICVACLNIVSLQLSAALKSQVTPISEIETWKSVANIRRIMLGLAINTAVLDTIRSAAQRCLATGWRVLFPMISSRIETMLHLTPDVSEKECVQAGSNAGKEFLLKLFVTSLISDDKLNEYFDMAAVEEEKILSRKHSSDEDDYDMISGSNKQLITFLSELFKALLGETKALITDSSKEGSCHQPIVKFFTQLQVYLTTGLLHKKTHINGLTSLLRKYMDCLSRYLCDVLEYAMEIVHSRKTIVKLRRKALMQNVINVMTTNNSIALFSLLTSSLILLNMEVDRERSPLQTSVDCKMMIKTFHKLEAFISMYQTSCTLIHDMKNMTWPGLTFATQQDKHTDNLPKQTILRKHEIDNHNIEGGNWLIKNGCVYDEANQNTVEGDRFESNYIGDYLPPDKDVAHSENSTVEDGCIAMFVNLQCSLASLISSHLSYLHKQAGKFAAPVELSEILSSKLLSGGLHGPVDKNKSLDINVSKHFIPLQMCEVHPEEDKFMWSLLHDVTEKESCSIMLPERYCQLEDKISCDAAKVFLNYVDKVTKKNPISTLIHQNHMVHMFGRFMLIALLRHLDLLSAALTFSLHHEKRGKLPSALLDVVHTVVQAQTKIIYKHQTSKISYAELCESAISRLSFLISLNPATSNPLLNVIAKEQMSYRSRWKEVIIKVITQLRMKKSLEENDDDDGSDKDEDKNSISYVKESLSKMKIGSKHRCDLFLQMLLDVSLDSRKRKLLACRMNGKISKSTFDKSLPSSIITFALSEDITADTLDTLRHHLVNRKTSITESSLAAFHWMKLIGSQYTLTSVSYCLIVHWIDPFIAFEKQETINNAEPMNEGTSEDTMLTSHENVSTNLDEIRSVDLLQYKIIEKDLSLCIIGCIKDLLTTDKWFLHQKHFICAGQSFRRNVFLEDEYPCKRLDDGYNVSVTTRFFLLFMNLLRSSTSANFLSSVWKSGTHALLYNYMKTLRELLPNDFLDKDKSQHFMLPSKEASGAMGATALPCITETPSMKTEKEKKKIFGNQESSSLSPANIASISSASLEEDLGFLRWKKEFSEHPLLAMLCMTTWCLPDFYLHSGTLTDSSSRCLSTKLCDIVACNYNVKEQVISEELACPFISLKFVKLVAKRSGFWNNTTSMKWIELLKKLIGSNFESLSSGKLSDKVSALQLLQDILLKTDKKYFDNANENPINYLFTILGILLHRQSILNGNEDMLLNDHLLPPSNAVCEASQIIDVIRCLHKCPKWQNDINTNLRDGLAMFSNYYRALQAGIIERNFDLPMMLAAFSVLGRSCETMHVGKSVMHKQWGRGVVTSMAQKGKVMVYFKSQKEHLNCSVPNLEILFESNTVCEKFPWHNTSVQACADALKFVLDTKLTDKNKSSQLINKGTKPKIRSNDENFIISMTIEEVEKHQLAVILLQTLPTVFRNKQLVQAILEHEFSLVDTNSQPTFQPINEVAESNDFEITDSGAGKDSKDTVPTVENSEEDNQETNEIIEVMQNELKQKEDDAASVEHEIASSTSLASIGSLQPNTTPSDDQNMEKLAKSTLSSASDHQIHEAEDKSLYLAEMKSSDSLVQYSCSDTSSMEAEFTSVPCSIHEDEEEEERSSADTRVDEGQNIIQNLLSLATKSSSIKSCFSLHDKEHAILVLLEIIGSQEREEKITQLIYDRYSQNSNSNSKKNAARKSRRSRMERRKRHEQQITFNELCHSWASASREQRKKKCVKPGNIFSSIARSYVNRLKSKPQLPAEDMHQLKEMGFSEVAIRNAYSVLSKSTSTTSLLPLWDDSSHQQPSLQEVVVWLLEHPDHMNPPIPNDEASSESDSGFTILESNMDQATYSVMTPSSSETSSDSSSTNSDNFKSVGSTPHSDTFKSPRDFTSSVDYAEYIRRYIKTGMKVVCCRPYEEIKKGFTGHIVNLDFDGLNDLNVQVYWDQKCGTYWVRYIHIQLLNSPMPPSPDGDVVSVTVGDKVRVKRNVTPKYKWGQVTPSSVGVLVSFQSNGRDAVVRFPEQPRWIAPANELEIVPVTHDNVTCGTCTATPIEGYRYRCSLCADFNMCSKCFFTISHATPRHVFNLIEAPGNSPRPVGPAGEVQNRKPPPLVWEESEESDMEATVRKYVTRCTDVRDHGLLVDRTVASSAQNKVQYLWDGNKDTCWKSDGVAGDHHVNIHMKPGAIITKLVMEVNPDDSSYMPSSIVVSTIKHDKRSPIYDSKFIHVQPYAKHVLLLAGCSEHYDVIEIQIKQCRNAGINCKIRGLEAHGYIDEELIPQHQDMMMQPIHCLTDARAYLSDDCFEDNGTPRHKSKRYSTHQLNKHSLLKTKAYVWGLNDKDQLSGPKESKVKTPVFSDAISRLKVKQIIGGSKSLFVVTVEGRVYSCGESSKGRLGHGSVTSNISTLTQITSLSSHVVKKVAVHSGGCHCLAMTLQGRVFSWGDGDDGKLGHSSRADCLKPRLIEALKGHEVIDVACGSAHSAAVTSTGMLFTWGQGSYGRLGHGNNETLLKPKPVRHLRYKTVIKVACGSRDAQTLCLTSDGFVYSWGDGDFGKLGRGGSNGCSSPLLVTKLENQNVKQIECGAQFSLALSSDGRVWTWGKGDYFRLGQGTDEHVRKPQIIEELKDKKIINVAVGALHCLVVTDKGEVYSWGDNDHGQQGNGTTTVNRKPCLVSTLSNLNITHVACGSSHSVAWSVSKETEMLLQPILFNEASNKLGMQPTNTASNKASDETESATPKMSLSKIILLLKSHQEKEKALQNILRSLQVDFARNVIGQLLHHNTVNDDRPINKQNEAVSSSTSCTSDLNSRPSSSLSTTSGDQVQCNIKESEEEKCEPLKLNEELEELEADVPGCSYHPPHMATSSSSVPQKTSEHAMASLIAETITSPEEIVIPTPKKGETTSQIRYNDDKLLVDYLSPKDVSKITSLLKLVLSGRMQHNDTDGLIEALRRMVIKDKIICDLLLEECIHELDEVLQIVESLSSKVRQTTEESAHPYPDDSDTSGRIKIQGASRLSIIFDRHCSTEPDHDILTIYKGEESKPIASLSGRDASTWNQILHIEGNEFRWRFKSDASVNGWGWKFTVQPTTSIGFGNAENSRENPPKPQLLFVSNILSVFFKRGHPPLEALSENITDSKKDLVNQLVQRLSSCLQVNIFGCDQKLWALKQLRHLLECSILVDRNCLSRNGTKESGKTTSLSIFRSFVKVFPDILLCQYNYESPEVQSGKQLLHSKYMKELASLACDMHIESMISSKDRQRLSSLQQFFMATRALKSLCTRTYFQPQFLKEVNDKLDGMHIQHEEDVYCDSVITSHEDNHNITVEMDQQLVQWINKRPDDWSQMWGGSRQIFGWGHNHRGQLGGIEGAKVKVPTQCSTLSSLRPLSLVGGEQTLYIVTADGKVYATGYGAGGRLGIGSNDSIAVPTLLESIQHVHITQVAVNSGGKHILALSADGEVYSWGEGAEGKLGHGTRTSCDRPRIIESLRGVHIVYIAAGGAHSAAIAKNGDLYTWGKGRYGRLGHGDSEDRLKPKLVEALRDYHVIDVSCGNGDAQTLCITKNPDSVANNLVWSWGDGDYGKLGRDGSDGCKVPLQIQSLQDKGIITVKCGSQFSLALSKTGLVYTWGKGDYYRLGHNSDQHVRLPHVVEGLRGKKVTAVSTGSLHCVVCTVGGNVYTWGDNDEGQAGDGTLNSSKEPTEIIVLRGKGINRVACGSAHSIAWSTGQQQPNEKHHDLPAQIPMEFNHLQNVPMPVLRNRLVLLNYFSEIFCPWVSLFAFSKRSPATNDTTSSLDEATTQQESDILRTLLVTSGKECVFKKVVQSTMLRDKQHGPVIELNRIRVRRKKANGTLSSSDGSKSVFAQVEAKMGNLLPENVLLPHRVWKVKFVGESVDDCGGGYSESVAEICEELQDGSLSLLIPTPNAMDEAGANRDCFLLRPLSVDQITTTQRNMFKFLGVLFGIAIRTGSPLSLNIAEPVWKQLSKVTMTLQDISEVDKEFLPRLMFIRDSDAATLDSMQIPYTVTSATGEKTALPGNHSIVTVANRNDYIRLSINYRLHEFDTVVDIVREGMSKVIPLPLLMLFTHLEAQTMVCGNPDIPLALLKSVSSFKGTSTNDMIPIWFWEVMEEMTIEERSLFLRFVWGRTRLPRTIADFRGRDFVIQVLDKYIPPDHYLPESYTCFFLLKLPRYSCKIVLEQKLKYAIHFCKSIDTDEYARLALNENDEPIEDHYDDRVAMFWESDILNRTDSEAMELARPSLAAQSWNQIRRFLNPMPDLGDSSTSGPDSLSDDELLTRIRMF